MNPLPIVYIVSIEIITSPLGCKIFYCAEISQFFQAVVSNCLPQHAQFPYALASFSPFGKHCCYIAFRKMHCLPKLLPAQNVVFDLRSGRSSLSVRVFASTPILSVPLGASSGACVLRGFPTTGLVNPPILRRRRFALGRSSSSALPSSAEVLEKTLTLPRV